MEKGEIYKKDSVQYKPYIKIVSLGQSVKTVKILNAAHMLEIVNNNGTYDFPYSDAKELEHDIYMTQDTPYFFYDSLSNKSV